MISVKEAEQLVNKHCSKLESTRVDLYDTTGTALAEDIYAQTDSPPYNQSAMDGYAYEFSEGNDNKSLVISDEIAADDSPKNISIWNFTFRIFTSIADYDFVAMALESCDVKCIFHKIKQKQRKPLYFGIKNRTLVFGLPGKPAALLTCFYEYIAPTLMKMMGHSAVFNSNLELKLSDSYTKKPGLPHFLKGKVNGNEVTILNAQESYLMSSFVVADCIVQLDELRSTFEKESLLRCNP